MSYNTPPVVNTNTYQSSYKVPPANYNANFVPPNGPTYPPSLPTIAPIGVPSQYVQPSYVQPSYVQPSYVQPSYVQPSSGLNAEEQYLYM